MNQGETRLLGPKADFEPYRLQMFKVSFCMPAEHSPSVSLTLASRKLPVANS
jgi:hypothetical protein